MELKLVENGFDYIRKRKKLAFIVFAVGFSSYGCYRAYHAPFIAHKRKKFSKIFNSLVSVAEAVSESADTIGIVTKDVKDFLQSDSDQVPNSLNQISKISRSGQFSDSLVSFTSAVTVGVLRGYQSMNGTDENQSGSGSTFADQVFDKLFTPAGSGFASVVIGSFAKNLVLGFYSNDSGKLNSRSGESGCSGSDSGVPKWVDVVCGDKCGELIGNCVQLFVSTLVAVYLDKTMHINTYDEFFSGLTNPKHETRVREMLVSVCNGAIESFVKTSHQVFNSSNPNDSSGSVSYFDTEETPSSVETSYVESKGDVGNLEDKGLNMYSDHIHYTSGSVPYFDSSNLNDSSGSVPYFDTGETLSSVETSYVESKGDVGDEEDKGLNMYSDHIHIILQVQFRILIAQT
ncbi:protein PHLOEM PROTEIN 2-LIKE A10-like isoform X2 [Trifolium pratense]|uniref:protein PHLOEM PROTEIN 2-LIKE A10-like isoform X2 n=1 Tax=Trifolium pratense TaxID=57577 RepID=UPI001E690E89|nr:protein PHLOEM PROTEIN 2-LIKE A10-like isoform X2 [Trifolium pratense]